VEDNAQEPIMSSGEKCQIAGIYWSSGCDHADIMYFLDGDNFPYCRNCDLPIKWIYRKPLQPTDAQMRPLKRK
jgi:hypothetical protein